MEACVEGALNVVGFRIADISNLLRLEVYLFQCAMENLGIGFVDFDVAGDDDGVKEGREVVVAEEFVDMWGVIKVGDEAEGIFFFELLKNGNRVGVKGHINLPGTDAFDGCALEGVEVGIKM